MVPALLRAGLYAAFRVKRLRFAPRGHSLALVVEGRDAKSIREVERCGWIGFIAEDAIEPDGLFDLGSGDAVLLHLRTDVCGMTESVGELRCGVRGAEDGDGFGVIDGRPGAVACVATRLGDAGEGFGAFDGLICFRLRGGLFVEALGVGGFTVGTGVGSSA